MTLINDKDLLQANLAPLLEQIEAYPFVYWTTISFAEKKVYSHTGVVLTEEEVSWKMLAMYKTLQMSVGGSLHPLMFKNYPWNSHHYHIIECSTEPIKRKARATAFVKTFKNKMPTLPKDLYSSMIKSEIYDKTQGALFYCAQKHDQLFTSTFQTKKDCLNTSVVI